MSGKEPDLSPLELRKRLLIAESEINRVQLRRDWETMAQGIRGVADRAITISSYASVVAALLAGLTVFRRSPAPAGGTRRSWVRTILEGLRVATSIWLAFRPRRHDDASGTQRSADV